MSSIAEIVTWIARGVFALYLYDLVVSFAGLLPLPRTKGRTDWARFAILVCAHDEERVVAGIVRSVLAQRYPRDKLEVFVVADNCTDRTAEIARAAGATVFERHDDSGRTKGYALQYGMDALLERGGFDALCVFDADNVVAPDFLSKMSGYLADGHVAIQGYLDTKNPFDSWVTRCIALGYVITNRFWLRARARLGLPATLGGTGFCLSWDIASKYRWNPKSLADDLELTMKLIRDGVHVSYAYDARIFDEKPLTLRLSFRQRARWMQGHNDVAMRWTGPMLWAVLRRRSFACIDAVLHLLQPVRLLLAFSAICVLGIAWGVRPDDAALAGTFWFTPAAWAIAGVVFVAYPALLAVRAVPLRQVARIYPLFMLFAFTWIPAIVLGLVRVRRRVWIHTAHGLSVTDVEPPSAALDPSAPSSPSVSTDPR